MTSKPELRISFEFFPPKPGEASDNFWKVIKKLEGVEVMHCHAKLACDRGDVRIGRD